MASIVFDFDGTIADTRDYFINFLAREAKQLPLSQELTQELHGLSLVQLASTLGFHWWNLPGLYFKGRRHMERAIKDLQPFTGMPMVIKKLHAEGHELFIVSSNSVRNIRVFLKHQNMREYFMEIYGGVEVFGKGSTLRRLIKDNNLVKEQMLCIGDEQRDIQAAKSLGLRTVAVTWGLAREADLSALQPSAIAHEPAELLRVLEDI
jgi:phosphoglycolate phosphatase